jgi:hypothetical protein
MTSVSRRQILGGAGAVSALGGAALLARYGPWRVLPVTDPVDLVVANWETESHSVWLRITDGQEVVFEDTIDVPAASADRPPARVREEAVLERVGRYSVVGELDDGTTDEYVLSPLDRPVWGTRMPELVVDIEGDIGRFWVGGAGGAP